MRRYEVSEIGDFHYRQLLMLVRFGMAEAHIVVRRCKGQWPQTNDVTDRRAQGVPTGVAIN
jgi:hypothetical protein